jgi:hypothetical protein
VCRVTGGWVGASSQACASSIGAVRYVWLAIIAVSAVPLLYVGMLANPFFVVVFGVDWWRERIARLYPYRWWVLFLILVCASSVAIYVASYG